MGTGRRTRLLVFLVLAFLAVSLFGCGGMAEAHAPPRAVDSGYRVTGQMAAASELEGAMQADAPAPMAPPQQAPGVPLAAKRARSDVVPSGATAGSEATPGTLLVYEAMFIMAVYQVDKAIDEVEKVAKKLGGHLVTRQNQQIVVRVPRAEFDAALAQVEKVGDVLQRNITSEDVTDQYHDLDTRLRNARAVRDRLEQLLAKAGTVEDSLKIERELERLTGEIERLAGALKLLSHRIAYSKVTVSFQPRHSEQVRKEILRLPFGWLDSLGLNRLLELRQ